MNKKGKTDKQLSSGLEEIRKLIKEYAKVYIAFEKLQDTKKQILPGGDQKTGVIAEYYAKCYIEQIIKGTNVEYAKQGEAYDISYRDTKGKKMKVQVKGVSEHSKTRIMAPLNLEIVEKTGLPPFDFLYLIALDLKFKPVGFYINTFKDVNEKSGPNKRIVGSVMQGKSKEGKYKDGSKKYDFEKDLVEEMKRVI